MTAPWKKNTAPDMGRLLLALPRDSIVLFSWTVSEYDGLGFVTTETGEGVGEMESCGEYGGRSGAWGVVSLFFPSEKRQDVLELTDALKSEGMSLNLLQEDDPSLFHGAKTEEDYPEEFDSI
ncbi:hypothetical protein [Aminivibrio sp.]|jgi:hypothetical protein|uniref:hypothetical protein n=1 Tax=Aminivibrio sp. TaxID=1872489 RepID=UPI001A3F4B12|nr:hypothetical protein [Aminivibrio sp.]MBL3538939.1 hypothetical protein [Aminivibrio sp.]MDK2958226.1 hypothetical protein [Synergistaceae bacterium]